MDANENVTAQVAAGTDVTAAGETNDGVGSDTEAEVVADGENLRALLPRSCTRRTRVGSVPARRRCEMGYWLGKPFWGQGIMPEAVKEMLRHAFEDCGMQKVWIGYYEGNIRRTGTESVSLLFGSCLSTEIKDMRSR